MTFLGEIKTRARHIVGPVLAATLFAYFSYHAVQGDRGLIAWLNLVQQVQDSQLEFDTLSAKRQILLRRVRLLQSNTLDRDLLDERTRAILGLAHPDDIIILSDDLTSLPANLYRHRVVHHGATTALNPTTARKLKPAGFSVFIPEAKASTLSPAAPAPVQSIKPSKISFVY
ncbi:MAG: FtsB family cell division protein [Alphaproteobacteria bacterium]|jgi:cell division protein FtsB